MGQTLEENRKVISAAEDVLFTTFSWELAWQINLPRYIDQRANKLNNAFWRLVKFFFLRYNETNTDCGSLRWREATCLDKVE